MGIFSFPSAHRSDGQVPRPSCPQLKVAVVRSAKLDLSYFQVANNPTQAATITPVAAQPKYLRVGGTTNFPMTFRLLAM